MNMPMNRSAHAPTVATPVAHQAEARDHSYIPSLDGLRAASIVLVFLSHAGMSHFIPGIFGVTVFFFLSGYLITTLLRQEWLKTGTISLSQFYLRRVLRIFPPLYTAIIAASVLCLFGVVSAALTWKAFFAQGLFLANYYQVYANGYGMPPGMEVLWSLAVEEHFYLLFPLLYLCLCKCGARAGRQALILGATCLAVLAWRIVLVSVFDVDTSDGSQGWSRIAHASDTRLDSILLGCLLAVYGNPVLDKTRISEAVWKRVLAPLGVVLLVTTFVHRDPDFRSTLRYTVQGIALVPIFVVGVRYPTWWPMRPLNWRWVRRIGVLSYSLYLLHYFIIGAVKEWIRAPSWAQVILSFLLSYAASDLMFRLVEQPFARIRKRLAQRTAKAPRVVAAAQVLCSGSSAVGRAHVPQCQPSETVRLTNSWRSSMSTLPEGSVEDEQLAGIDAAVRYVRTESTATDGESRRGPLP